MFALVNMQDSECSGKGVSTGLMRVVGQTISLSHLLLLSDSNPDESKPPPILRPKIHQPTCHSELGVGGRNDNDVFAILSSAVPFLIIQSTHTYRITKSTFHLNELIIGLQGLSLLQD